MGPRLFSRGNAGDPELWIGVRAFNGAATLQSRKWITDMHGVTAPVAFNGAATLQSRKSAGTGRHVQADLTLQWGRDSSVAEMGVYVVEGIRLIIPSMGPRLFSRGNQVAVT